MSVALPYSIVGFLSGLVLCYAVHGSLEIGHVIGSLIGSTITFIFISVLESTK